MSTLYDQIAYASNYAYSLWITNNRLKAKKSRLEKEIEDFLQQYRKKQCMKAKSAALSWHRPAVDMCVSKHHSSS